MNNRIIPTANSFLIFIPCHAFPAGISYGSFAGFQSKFNQGI
jgi:hypothetical protein